ncbi:MULTISPECIES: curli assembly protein CsgF [Rhodobacterales]|uniref:curli assembly protein CsgF n=1 Tax=Rhodobacterales TaxID=204455 RepID=UPI001EF671AC|nr:MULTISPECIES: curli assembly protein CsgF [unclassified Epibacterium]MCG7625195.1 curli assembly protein CsgF [Epibacterium sp. Ofav1-8]MCG7630228.1 curli assembly protein CsgF [Epibacterium sp. MM17-32]
MIKHFVVMTAACLFSVSAASGSELVYRPINPSFGGNPLNSGHLLQLAEIQNQHLDSNAFGDLFEEPTLADEFADAIRNGMITIAAGELLDAVVQRENPTGTMDLDGAIVSWVTSGDRVTVTINDGVSTNTLDLPIPVQN